MAQEFDNTNRFVLFVNNDKQKDTHADRTGTVNIDGKEYWLNGWNKSNNVISGTVRPKEESKGRDSESWKKAQDRYGNKQVENADEPINLEDIPF